MVMGKISQILSPNYRGLRRLEAALAEELQEAEGLENLARERLEELGRGESEEVYHEAYRRLSESTSLRVELGNTRDSIARHEASVGRKLRRAGYAAVGALIIASLLAAQVYQILNYLQNNPARAPKYPISYDNPITKL